MARQGEALIALAKARTPADRERLLLAIIALCEQADSAGALETPQVQGLLGDIFTTVAVEAERGIRQRLAEALATAAWAPRGLINILALDDIEIARPIIASSPVLDNDDLIRLLHEATIEHQIEVARRPSIAAPVVDAIVGQGAPAVLTALAMNPSAEITPAAMARLIELSRSVAPLRSPLAHHPRLTADLAGRLCVWAADPMKTSLEGRFSFDAAAVGEARPFGEPASVLLAERGREREEMERRLVEKLYAAGQLRAGYLLRALREGRLSLFEAALAKLGGFTYEEVRGALSCERPELLALACSSVGLDRSVFPTVLAMVRELNAGSPAGPADIAQHALGAFGSHPASVAATAFRHAVAAV